MPTVAPLVRKKEENETTDQSDCMCVWRSTKASFIHPSAPQFPFLGFFAQILLVPPPLSHDPGAPIMVWRARVSKLTLNFDNWPHPPPPSLLSQAERLRESASDK